MKNLQPLIYATLIAIGVFIGNGQNKTKIIVDNKLSNILHMINDHYVDSLNYANFETDAINSILSKLDPHSSYISIKDAKSVQEDMQGSFSGIGIEFNIIKDSIVVVSPISGGPSEKLGIRSGDRIINVEKEDVANTDIRNEDVIKLLRGKKGDAVNIIIKRRGENGLIPFKIIRDDIPIYSVDAGIMLTNNIGFIKISRFSATTYNEMMEKANTLKAKGMEKLILDFRSNPGGYLHIANQICDEFLREGELIVFTEGRNRSKQKTFATKNGSLQNIEIIVLINEGSASASEIVSGALQDNDRGLIIGRRSFGKGLVQEQISLSDGSVMRLTTQRYYTPSGRCIQKDYGENTKDYYLEQYMRTDVSKEQLDSLKYTTKKGRTVYGGGGITPDIIIDRDTNINYLQINKMMNKGWINEFCFEKSELLKRQNISNYEQIKMANFYSDFILYLDQKDNNFEIKLGSKELQHFKNLILATISRNMWDNNTYYKVLSQEDEYIQRAITEF
jgi:carboxyl-terminal processing protease